MQSIRRYFSIINLVVFFSFLLSSSFAQKKMIKPVVQETPQIDLESYFKPVLWRNLGHTRGGRSVTATGIKGNNQTYYMGTTGGGVWKTEDAGQSWKNISDGYFESRPDGSKLGAIVSNQSEVIPSRASLEEKLKQLEFILFQTSDKFQ